MPDHVAIAFNETVTEKSFAKLVGVFEDLQPTKRRLQIQLGLESRIPASQARKSAFLTHPVFNSYHSETSLMRYIKRLERKDLALNHSMISLGSCTMKLNAASEMLPLSWAQWNGLHPFVPLDQAQGYQHILKELEEQLNEVTGFYATSLQPNSGAQGEYAGLMVIRAYHSRSRRSSSQHLYHPCLCARNQPCLCRHGGNEGSCYSNRCYRQY